MFISKNNKYCLKHRPSRALQGWFLGLQWLILTWLFSKLMAFFASIIGFCCVNSHKSDKFVLFLYHEPLHSLNPGGTEQLLYEKRLN